MDKLLKHAVNSDAVNFVKRFKDKMTDHFKSAHGEITKTVAADMAGVEPVQEEGDGNEEE